MTAPTDTPATATDALVIGAGPAGLYAAFQLGLLGMRTHIADALPHAGGQPVQLYADKAIYDIPAIPACTARQLTDALLQQLRPLAPAWHLGHLVQGLQRQADGRWLATSDQGAQWLAKTVFIAAGAGAFMPKKLRTEGADALHGHQLFYTCPPAQRLAGLRVVVLGGEDAALACAAELACAADHAPASVTLLHRRATHQASDGLLAQVQALAEQGTLALATGQVQGFDTTGDGRMHALHLLGPDGGAATLAADALIVMQGLSPKLGPVADWHLALERKHLRVDTEKFQTSEAGIFAIGDVNTYPGKQKLIACAFHEATLAAHAALALAAPERTGPLQYTSSSAHLQRLLGVRAEPPDGHGGCGPDGGHTPST